MADREERFLMRQRGAGARQLRDSGFNIAIPELAGTPSQPQSSGQPRRTPGTQRRTPLSGASRRRTIATPVLDQVQETSVEEAEENAEEEVSNGPQTVQKNVKTTQTPNAFTAGRKRKSPQPEGNDRAKRSRISFGSTPATRPGIQSGAEEDDVLTSPATLVVPSTAKRARPRSSLGTVQQVDSVPSPEGDDDELVSPPVAQQRSRQPRKSDAPISMKKQGKQPLGPHTGNSSQRARPTAAPVEASKPRQTRRPRPPAAPSKPDVEPESPEADDADSPAGPSDPSRKAARRRSSAAEPRTKRSKKHTQGAPPAAAASTSKKTSKPRRPRRSSGAANAPSPAASPSTTAPPVPGTIPITVHRLAHGDRLTFFQPSDDELAGPAPLRKHAGVNSIDILAQVARELVVKTATSLRDAARRTDGPRPGAARRQAQAVERFGEAFDATMLQMTAALDHHIGLTQQQRHLAKKRAALLAELLELRTQRRRAALQQDAVRARHAAAAAEAGRDAALNSMMHDIELAAARGRAAVEAAGGDDGDADGAPGKEEVGVELRVREVVERVSSAGGRTGLLQRLQRFNAYLEAVIDLPEKALQSRRSSLDRSGR